MTARLYVLPTAPQSELDLDIPPRDDIRPTCRCNGFRASVQFGELELCGACAFEFLDDDNRGKHYFTDRLHDLENECVRLYGDLEQQLRASLKLTRRQA